MNNIFLYNNVLTRAKEIFLAQSKKYGNSFVEASSLTLCCLAKSRAQRVKTLLKQGSNVGAVGEPIEHSLYGIINYSIMNIILQNSGNSWDRINADQLWYLYDTEISGLTKLYLAKTRDYDDEWRTIPAIALIEIVLMKFRRIEALYSKDQKTNTVPELQDIINYAIFAIILWSLECKNSTKVGCPGGKGLFDLHQYFLKNRGDIQIITGDTFWSLSLENTDLKKQIFETPFVGSIINLCFSI